VSSGQDPSLAAAVDGADVLVTGATGLIGSALVDLLSRRPCRLRLLARAVPDRVPGARAEIQTIAGDARDAAVLTSAARGVDVVFHLAAQTSVRLAERDPVGDFQANVQPVLTLLTLFREEGRRPVLLLAGSETQAGVPMPVPLDESALDRPATVYDLHKLMAEQYLELSVRLGLVRGACLRLPTVYGPGPRERGEGRGLIGGSIRRALLSKPLEIRGGGAYLRDFLHAADAARAFVAAAAALDRLDRGHFVIGTGTGSRVDETIRLVAREVHRQAGIPVSVDEVGRPPGWSAVDERSVVVDASAFIAATCWTPSIALEDGIRSTVAALVAGPLVEAAR
jgi:nucleoside-diphosphate-sugar epimerase